MTPARRVVLAVGFLAVAAMGVFPPWVTAPENHPSATTPAGYHFVWEPPPADPRSPLLAYLQDLGSKPPVPRFVRVDYARLAVQWAAVAALVGVAMLLGRSGAGVL